METVEGLINENNGDVARAMRIAVERINSLEEELAVAQGKMGALDTNARSAESAYRIIDGQYKNALEVISGLKTQKQRALDHNKSIIRCVKAYRDIDKDRAGADPEKRISKSSMVDLIEETAQGQAQLLEN